eukprot:363792-Pelagomonas_calceolata.AAC.2
MRHAHELNGDRRAHEPKQALHCFLWSDPPFRPQACRVHPTACTHVLMYDNRRAHGHKQACTTTCGVAQMHARTSYTQAKLKALLCSSFISTFMLTYKTVYARTHVCAYSYDAQTGMPEA